MLVLPDEVIDPPAVSYPAASNADAVGAGDACTAGILVGWSLGLPRRARWNWPIISAHSSPRSQVQRRCCRARSFRWSSEHDLHHPIAAEVGLFRLLLVARQTDA